MRLNELERWSQQVAIPWKAAGNKTSDTVRSKEPKACFGRRSQLEDPPWSPARTDKTSLLKRSMVNRSFERRGNYQHVLPENESRLEGASQVERAWFGSTVGLERRRKRGFCSTVTDAIKSHRLRAAAKAGSFHDSLPFEELPKDCSTCLKAARLVSTATTSTANNAPKLQTMRSNTLSGTGNTTASQLWSQRPSWNDCNERKACVCTGIRADELAFAADEWNRMQNLSDQNQSYAACKHRLTQHNTLNWVMIAGLVVDILDDLYNGFVLCRSRTYHHNRTNSDSINMILDYTM